MTCLVCAQLSQDNSCHPENCLAGGAEASLSSSPLQEAQIPQVWTLLPLSCSDAQSLP